MKRKIVSTSANPAATPDLPYDDSLQTIMPFLDTRLSKAQIITAARELHHDEHGIENLFALMTQTENRRTAYNAAWILTHLPVEDKKMYLLPRYTELVSIATSETLCFRRGLVLSILTDLPVSNEPNSNLLEYCMTHITDMKENDSTRSYMIKLAARMCKPYPELCNELMLTLEIISQNTSPSIACAKKNALKLIGQIRIK